MAEIQERCKFMADQIRSFRDLRVYQEAFDLQQEIFRISRKWPSEEKYALIGQIRRSSRSIGANIAESWAKRPYAAHFISKLTDADGELQETSHWLATAVACEYLSEGEHSTLQASGEEIGRGIGKMMSMPEKFVPQKG
jgi:four helix bundle protein